VRFKKTNPGSLSSVKRWTVVACLLLIAFVTAAQVLHSHPDGLANEARHCTVCQVAHAPANVGLVAQLAVGFTVTAFLSYSADIDPKPLPDSFSLFCRPPPSLV
jgi:hypothetical protein